MSGGIEFLSEEFDDDAPPPQSPPPRRSWSAHWVVRVAVFAIVVVVAATWVLTRPSGGGRGNGAGGNPAAAPAATGVVSPEAPSGSTPRSFAFTPDARVDCALGTPVANEVTDAMHRYLRGIVVDNLNSYRCVRTVPAVNRIVFEAVRGRYRGLDIVVELTARAARGEVPLPQFQVSDLGGATNAPVLRTIQTEGAALLIQIAVSGRRTAAVPTTELADLADFLTLNIYL